MGIPRKKLIEVALPLEEINKQSAREKSIRHGHPSTLHLWWARRPLAACRAVLFASLVDDPGEYMPDEESSNAERERLFRLIERLVNWDNVNDGKLLAEARLEIARSVARNLGVEMPVGEAAIHEFLATQAPPVLDPFCGGGSIPLEAQRLGLRAYASDLNPVAVLITKALIEIPPKFANHPPVHPPEEGNTGKQGKKGKGAQLPLETEWKGAAGLAEDVRYYGKWMRDEAEKRIGHLYPKVKLPKEYGGGEATVIAWLWARTVKCPNPACGATMPLVSSFWLSTKVSNPTWVEPIVNGYNKTVGFDVKVGKGSPPPPPKIGRGAKFKCLVCNLPVSDQYIKSEGVAGRMSSQLMSIVTGVEKHRIYIPPVEEHAAIARSARPKWKSSESLPDDARGAFWCRLYGLTTQGDLFTPRQLVMLNTLSELIKEVHAMVSTVGNTAYADAMATYLAFAVDKTAARNTSLCFWDTKASSLVQTFGRQGLPMIWDYAETNPFGEAGGDFGGAVEWLCRVIDRLPNTSLVGLVHNLDAGSKFAAVKHPMISTDPPYYDNIGYADLSDFFQQPQNSTYTPLAG